jgi:hypothetical protein
VIAAYFTGILIYAPGAPFGDDFAMIDGAQQFASSANLSQAWSALAAQHNEHRPIAVRFIFWIVGLLPEPPNVALIALVGNLSLLVMFALLLREGNRVRAHRAFIVVAAVLMFNFGLSESSIWAMAAVSNFGVLSAMMAALALLSLGAAWHWAALAVALVSVGMQGNGLLTPFLGAGYLLFNKRLIPAAIWLVVSVVVLLWFFTDYRFSQSGNLQALISEPFEIALYALAFCGSAVGFGSESLGAVNIIFVSLAATLGAAMMGLSVYSALNGGFRDGRIALWVNLFIVVSAFATAVSRIDYGVQQALVPRYHINSCLMVAATLIAMLDLGENSLIQRRVNQSMSMFGILAPLYALAMIPIFVIIVRIHSSAPT